MRRWHWAVFILNSLLCVAQDTIIDTIKAVPELSSLAEYISKSHELASWLEEEEITLFAPRNEAFEQSPSWTVEGSDELKLTILSHHVVKDAHLRFSPGRNFYLSTFLPRVKGSKVEGGNLLIARASAWSNVTTLWSDLERPSQTIGAVIPCKNGAIHILDRMLTLPLNFSHSYTKSPMFGPSPFVGSILTQHDSAQLVPIDRLRNVTVFLPIYHAFRQIGNLVNQWSAHELREILSYHVVDQIVLTDANGPRPGIYSTLEGGQVSVSADGQNTFINNVKVVGSNHWIFEGGVIYTIFG